VKRGEGGKCINTYYFKEIALTLIRPWYGASQRQ